MKFQTSISKHHAMTLVEVMIAIAAASAILTGVILIYISSSKITSGAIAQLAVQAQARQGIDRILNDVKRSERAVIYTSFNGAATYAGSTNTDAGAYIIFQLSTNTLTAGELQYHHYYIGNLKSLGNGVTNGTLYTFSSSVETDLSTAGASNIVVRGVTNPDRVFDWINGVVNLNIRLADENDVDGKQIIYLRSAVAFRNGD
jgi:hypothetical protein